MRASARRPGATSSGPQPLASWFRGAGPWAGLAAPVTWLPDPAAALCRLTRRLASNGVTLDALVRGGVALSRGDLAAAGARLAEHQLTAATGGWVGAAARLLEARIAAREEDGARLRSLVEHATGARDDSGRALLPRLRAVQASLDRAADPEGAGNAVRAALRSSASCGDTSAQAGLQNLLGVLARRAGQANRAADHFADAAGMGLLCGDLYLVEGALLNLSHAQHTLGQREARDRNGDAALWLGRTLGVGQDSTQTELWAATRAAESRDGARAWEHIEAAERIAARLESQWEQAAFLRARGQIARKFPRPGIDPDRELRTSERLFRAAGDEDNAREAARLRMQKP